MKLNVANKSELAEQLYNVQTQTGLSVLVSLAICAIETGWGRNLRSKSAPTYNLWNFGCSSSLGDWGHYFDNAGGIANAFQIFHDEFLKQYYDPGSDTIKSKGGPFKTLAQMSDTYCPSSIQFYWATDVGKCAVMISNFIL